MKIIRKTIKNANITIVAEKLYTSFISQGLFEGILTTAPLNVIQMPPLGMLDYPQYNFIVDVDNRRVTINQKSGDIESSKAPEMAKRFFSEAKGVQVVAVGFNFTLELSFDENFAEYSKSAFIMDACKTPFGNKLSGFGFKAYVKDDSSFNTFNIEPSLADNTVGIVTANYHYEIPDLIEYEDDFKNNYQKLMEYIGGIFN